MSFSISPAVTVSEIDLNTVVPSVSTTEGAIAGVFRWGPVYQRVLVDSETTLVSRFAEPTNFNAETFFTAANFLAYGNQLYVVRTANTTDPINGAFSAVANTAAVSGANSSLQTDTIQEQAVLNLDDLAATTFDPNVLYVAKYPGSLGNSLRVSVCDSSNAYNSTLNLIESDVSNDVSLSNITYNLGSNAGLITLTSTISGSANAAATDVLSGIGVGDYIQVGNTTIGSQYLQVSGKTVSTESSNAGTYTATATLSFTNPYSLPLSTSSQTINRFWEFFHSVNKAPGTSQYAASLGLSVVDQIHVVVVDQLGDFSTPGNVLEVWESLSRATDAKDPDGSSIFYETVLNYNSNYIWQASDSASAQSGLARNLSNSSNHAPLNLTFAYGADGGDESNISLATVLAGYDMFSSTKALDVSLILQVKARGMTAAGSGPSGEVNNYSGLGNYLISNIAEGRMDCVAIISPAREDVVNVPLPLQYVINFRNNLNIASSYGFLDSGYKYQYDKYNDVYRYVPLNGDIAGLIVQTDSTRDAWWSPAGFNRGNIKNVIKLAYNPNKGDRDQLFKNDINPVVVFPGQGTILFGDKTLYAHPSAFDAIGVRRLFIVLEKAIATASKFTLFEFNDAFTQAQFISMVEPFLRDIQGRRGIYDFKVVCDSTNNTPDVVDLNQFVGDIYIKPARSIRTIQLNFVAVRSGVDFSEIVGKF